MTQPAYVTGRAGTSSREPSRRSTLSDFSRVPVADRNTLILMFTGESSRKLLGDRWAAEGDAWSPSSMRPATWMAGDPTLRDFLVRRLTSESADFAEWWEAHEIREIGPGTKWLNRSDGTTIAGYTTFHPTEDPTLKLVVYNQVPGEADQ
ncbi:MAG: hypothetical protein R2705_18420 [Ilumatobacteraceae bacterium]